MNRRSQENAGLIVGGTILGIILASVLMVPFYGFGPVLAIIGLLLIMALVARVSGR
jgi:hypothetical protein